MYALRFARAFTGKPKIIKFGGGYHGMPAGAQMILAAPGARASRIAFAGTLRCSVSISLMRSRSTIAARAIVTRK